MSANGSGGTLWGAGGEVARALLLYMNRDVPIIGAIADLIDLRFDKHMTALRAIEGAFDLDTAQGQQLDILGVDAGLPRNGFSDDRYRRALKVQRALVLSTGGTRQGLIDVFTAWTGAAPVHYRNVYSKEVEISGLVAAEDESLLLTFLQNAAPGGTVINVFSSTTQALEDEHLITDAIERPTRSELGPISDLVFAPGNSNLFDPITGAGASTVDGTTYDAEQDARSFDGATDRVDFVPAPADLAGSAATVSAWVRPDTIGSEGRIFSTRESAGSGSTYLAISAAGRVRLLKITDGTLTDVEGSFVLPTNEWTHIAWTSTGSLTVAGQTLYVNGSEVSSYVTTVSGSGTERGSGFGWSIGGRAINDTANFDGLIADVRVWTRELSATEVQDVYGDPTGVLDYEPGDSLANAATLVARIQ